MAAVGRPDSEIFQGFKDGSGFLTEKGEGLSDSLKVYEENPDLLPNKELREGLKRQGGAPFVHVFEPPASDGPSALPRVLKLFKQEAKWSKLESGVEKYPERFGRDTRFDDYSDDDNSEDDESSGSDADPRFDRYGRPRQGYRGYGFGFY